MTSSPLTAGRLWSLVCVGRRQDQQRHQQGREEEESEIPIDRFARHIWLRKL